MKIASLFLSIFVFGIAAYFFVANLENTFELNYIIYMSLLLILMSIGIIGVMINLPLLGRRRRKMNLFLYNNFSKKKLEAKHNRIMRLKNHNHFKEEPKYQDIV